MHGQAGQALALGHRGAALHAGDDDRLAHAGQGIFGVQGRGCPAKTGHAGGVIVGDAVGVQSVHLLPDGTIQARVARVQAHRDFVRCFVFAHHGQHLLQRHFGAVVDGAIRLGQPQQGRVDQAARVDDAIRRLQQSRAALSDKIWCAGARPHKMYHVSFLSSFAAVFRPVGSGPAGRFGWRKAPPLP